MHVEALMSAEAQPVAAAAAAPVLKESKEVLTKKWTKPLIDVGYTAIPTIIVQRMGVLGLAPLDFAILCQLASYWWSPDQLPHPSSKAIADAIGMKHATVKKRPSALEKAKLIKRVHRPRPGNRHKTNEYSFQPLIEAVTPHALKELEAIEERKAAKLKSLTKKGKPALKAVPK